jgi:hypothetical protein
MISERELVGLLYRADWTKLSLSGTVTGAERVVDTVISVQTAEPLRAPWRREDDEGTARTLSVAPGQRFRADGADFGFTPPDGLPVFGAESAREERQPGTRSWSWNLPG